MSIHQIKDPEEANLYLFHGPMFSLDLGNKSSLHGSVAIDNSVSDPALSSGIFAFNNNKPVASKITSSLSTVENNLLLNMANITVQQAYPRQDEFGNPRAINSPRGLINNFVYFAPIKNPQNQISSLLELLDKAFYFYSESNQNWFDLNNWWMDENFTQQATEFPSNTNLIYIYSDVIIPESIQIITTEPININNVSINIGDSHDSSTPVLKSGSIVSLSNNSLVIDNIQNLQVSNQNFVRSNKLFEDDNFIVFDIENTLSFNGEFTLAFSSEEILPENNPLVIHVKYDEQTEQTLYEDITTDVSEGVISATTNSFSQFIVIKDTNSVPTIGIDGQVTGGFNPCLVLSGCSSPNNYNENNCGFDMPNITNWDCPGNQTRGSLIGGGNCGCYESSAITVDMIISAFFLVGAGRAALCGTSRAIAGLRISQLRQEYNIIQLEALSFREPLRALKQYGEDIVVAIESSSVMDGVIVRGILYTKEQAHNLLSKLGSAIERLTNKLTNLRIDLQNIDNAILKAEQQKVLLQAQQQTILGSLFVNLGILAGFLNNISILKTCPENETLDELTCECVPSCGPTSWRIIETADEVIYEENSITNNSLSGLPGTYSPPPYDYTGFMELQVFCEESGWQTLDSWTTLNSEPVKTFENNYSNPCCENGQQLNT